MPVTAFCTADLEGLLPAAQRIWWGALRAARCCVEVNEVIEMASSGRLHECLELRLICGEDLHSRTWNLMTVTWCLCSTIVTIMVFPHRCLDHARLPHEGPRGSSQAGANVKF
jgi:hypothetical protein